jgi:hypothetical protein
MNRVLSTCLALVAVVACSRNAAAEDPFGVGNGHDGPFVVPAGTTASVNVYTTLSADVIAGTSLSVRVADATGFQAGDLILLWQPATYVPAPPSGDSTPIDLSLSRTGRWELARVSAALTGILDLTSTDTSVTPLQQGFAAGFTQIVRIPEFTTVDVENQARLVPAQPWDGSKGGLVAFLATGPVTVLGKISADGSGFRGGLVFQPDTSGATRCRSLTNQCPRAQPRARG